MRPSLSAAARAVGNRPAGLLGFLAVGLLMGAVLLGGGQAQAAGQSAAELQSVDGYTQSVLALALRGIIKRPEDPSTARADLVTRRQMAVYLARLLRLPDEPFAPLVDVRPPDWGVGEVGAVRREGIMKGDSLVSFAPDRPVSRQEASALVIAALRYSAERQGAKVGDPLTPQRVDDCLAGFADRNLIASDYAPAVAIASRLGLLPAADTLLFPSLSLTHGELAPMLAKAFVEPLTTRAVYTAAVDPIKAYPNLSRGSNGPFVLLLEQKLTALHYPCGPVDGKYDYRTRDAVMAFQKYERLRRTGKVDAQFWQRFFVAQPPKPVKQGSGDRIETDLTRQILMMIRDEKVVIVLHVSTGKYGTPTGGWHLRSKNRGWVTCSLGPIYSPCYFMPKNAIHGYPQVPTYPASHGCIRTPIWLQDVLFRYLTVGMPVDVFYNRAR